MKRRAHLLCNYTGVEDPTYEVAEELVDDAVIEHMAWMVGARIIVMTESAIMAFSASHRSELASHPFSCLSSYPRLASVT